MGRRKFFLRTVRKLHRWLLDAPAQKGAPSTGKTIVGISTLLMVVILISGLVIWWPRSRKVCKTGLNYHATRAGSVYGTTVMYH